MSRQIVLDTETTGLDHSQGHRIIEIGCVELINRRLTGRHYHQYINPQRVVEAEAIEVHGITNEFLADKPIFKSIVDEFVAFVDGAELIIHNAPFDIGFINSEIRQTKPAIGQIEKRCGVIDTLVMARQKHPGQRATLDALCKRYAVDNSARDLHGALLDAEILADVYLLMTGGQTALFGGEDSRSDKQGGDASGEAHKPLTRLGQGVIITASDEELVLHENRLKAIDKASGGNCLWLQVSE